MAEQFLITALSAVFSLLALVLAVVLGLLWRQRHIPIIGFLWLFLLAALVREGVTAVILIGRATGLLPEGGELLAALGIVWFAAQFCQTGPAVLLGLYVLQVISARWITWLFRPKKQG